MEKIVVDTKKYLKDEENFIENELIKEKKFIYGNILSYHYDNIKYSECY